MVQRRVQKLQLRLVGVLGSNFAEDFSGPIISGLGSKGVKGRPGRNLVINVPACLIGRDKRHPNPGSDRSRFK